MSVILPVWNSGPEISRCIESLRNQTLSDIEMIFVDDCGTDDSMEKIRDAATEDPRIRILENEKNIGAGLSRNRGIEAARGEYISFVDPDDYVPLDYYEVLYGEAHKNAFDIVKGRTAYIKEDGSAVEKTFILNRQIRNGIEKDEPLYLLFTYEHQSAIFRKDFLHSSRARYGSSRRGEDTTFLLQACSRAKSFSIIDDTQYYLCEHLNSITHEASTDILLEVLQSVEDKVKFILQNLKYDPWAPRYLEGRLLFALQESLRYSEEPEMKQPLVEYATKLRSLFMRLPYHDDISNKSYPLRALKCYNCLLSSTPFRLIWEGHNPPIRYAKLVGYWIDYFLSMPQEAEACWTELRKVIGRAERAVNGIPSTLYSTMEQKEGKALLKKHIRRLPLNYRIQLEVPKFKIRARRIAQSLNINR